SSRHFLAGPDSGPEIAIDERVDVTVKDGRWVRRLHAGAQVLDHRVWLEDVVAVLVSPTRLDVIAPQLSHLRLALFHLSLDEPGAQDRHRALPVLDLAAFVLARHHDASREVGDAHGRIGLVDVLAAGA